MEIYMYICTKFKSYKRHENESLIEFFPCKHNMCTKGQKVFCLYFCMTTHTER